MWETITDRWFADVELYWPGNRHWVQLTREEAVGWLKESRYQDPYPVFDPKDNLPIPVYLGVTLDRGKFKVGRERDGRAEVADIGSGCLWNVLMKLLASRDAYCSPENLEGAWIDSKRNRPTKPSINTAMSTLRGKLQKLGLAIEARKPSGGYRLVELEKKTD